MNAIKTRPVNVAENLTENMTENMTDSRYTDETQFSWTWEIVKYLVSAAIIGLGVGVFIYLKSLATLPATAPSTALIQQVDIYPVQAYVGVLDRIVTGTVVPHREIKIAAEVGGRIKKKFPACEAGNYVSQGEPLVMIDPEEYELNLKTREADVQEAKRRIEENEQQIAGEKKNIVLAEVDLELQQNEFDRNQRLTKVLSQTELDDSQRALNSAKTQLTARQNTVATLAATTARLEAARDVALRNLEKAELNLRRTTIVAPENGVIVRENVQAGDYVSPGTQIVVFEDIAQAEVRCNLTPGDLEWIRDNSKSGTETMDNDRLSVYRIPKTEVTIFDPADPSVTWSGILERFDGIGRDEATKTIPCRIVVDKTIVETPKGLRALLRGMYVKCRIEVQTTSDSSSPGMLTFPAVALYPNQHVWTVVDGKLERVDIEIVDQNETTVGGELQTLMIAKSDVLQPGDRVVVSPLSQPTVGAPVIVRE